MRSSIVLVDSDIPVRVARGQLVARGERGARRCCDRSLSSGMVLRVTSPPALAGRRCFVRWGTNLTIILLGTAEQRRA